MLLLIYFQDLYTGFHEVPILESTPPNITESRFLKICLQATISHTRNLADLQRNGTFISMYVFICTKC